MATRSSSHSRLAISTDHPNQTITRVTTKRRSPWWRVHAWVGLKLSLFAMVIFLSGTLAVIANEIDWLVDPAMRATPSAQEGASWGVVAANAKAAVPGGHIDMIERGADPWFATTAVVRLPDGHRRRVLLDPATGKVNRVASFGSVQRFLRDFHRRFMLPVAIGLPLVTSLSVVLLTSLASGLVTYKKFWRGLFKLPRSGGIRKTTGDLHRLLGVWSIWFAALMAATGLWYLAEFLGANAPQLFPLRDDEGRLEATLAQPVGRDLDRIAAIAAEAYPELDVRRVQYPFPGVEAIGFQGHAGTPLTTEKANAVWINVATGAVEMKIVGDDLTSHQRIAEMADPLHFGTFGGPATKLAWFLFGAALTGLSATGVLIYATRVGKGRRPGWRVELKAVGGWWLPVVALVLLALWLSPAILAG